MALGLTAAASLTSLSYAALDFYVRGKAFLQTVEEKPLIRILRSKQKSFPGGKGSISEPVQGAFMSDTAGSFVGYKDDDALSFNQPDNLLRVSYSWKEVWSGFMVAWTQLKMDGITVNDPNGKRSEHAKIDMTRLTPWLQNQMEDFAESWARSFNLMLWKDGSQDSKQIPGLLYLLPDDPTTGTVGGLSRATYTWWRHRAAVGNNKITASPTNQTLTKKLRSEARQLQRYGGKPSVLLAGSAFIEALESEVHEKGIYTQSGFKNEGATEIGMAKIHMWGVGTFEYDPTLDDLGLSKRCYVIDPRRIQLMPMEGEDNKAIKPERPYNYLVYAQGMTWTGAMVMRQANCHGVYEVA